MNFELTSKDKHLEIRSKIEKLDTTVAPELKSILVHENGNGIKNIIIDLSETRYCDSSGLSAILVANRLCKGSNGILVLCGLQEPVKKLITISQLHTVLNITPTLSEAVDLLFMEEIEKDVDDTDS